MAGFTHAELAQALLGAVRQSLADAPRFDPSPNLDLAVVALPHDAPPIWANVLFSRDFPEGLVADIDTQAGAVQNLRYLADARQGSDGTSVAWVAGTDWRQLPADTFAPLAGSGAKRFIAPYPASLLKLMVAVGVAHLVDAGRADWDEPWPFGQAQGGLAPTVAQWAEPMITTSSNEATSALVALLHARGLIRRAGWLPGSMDGEAAAGAEVANGLHQMFEAQGLSTLRLANTRPDGGWFNSSGAGVGQLQMTAWDTVRLLWRLSEPILGLPAMPAMPGTLAAAGSRAPVPAPDADPDAIAPPAPWLPAHSAPLLQPDSRQRFWRWMRGQALHQVLSSGLVAGLPGWQPGIPAAVPARWLRTDGQASAGGQLWPGDLRPLQAKAEVVFAHKTGTTASYVSNAGRVVSLQPGGRRYLIALISTLGSRHAPHADLATDWCVPRLGAAVDGWLKQRLG